MQKDRDESANREIICIQFPNYSATVFVLVPKVSCKIARVFFTREPFTSNPSRKARNCRNQQRTITQLIRELVQASTLASYVPGGERQLNKARMTISGDSGAVAVAQAAFIPARARVSEASDTHTYVRSR